ncbi:MAG: hypothetical protein N4A74_14215 [Carboxylicivirga sp.]|nr:hypothetical protein [Carboxylicivirga sp.]
MINHFSQIHKRYSRTISALILMLVITSFSLPKTKYQLHQEIPIRDYELELLFDNDSILTGYRAFIQANVCTDSTCLPVKLYFYWKITGDFHRYQLLPQHPLTKNDHEEFNADDYRLLTNLLLEKEPALKQIEYSKVISNDETVTIDGFSGATSNVIKNEVVQGAAYTCFTLWHIAHGKIVDEIKARTSQHLTPALIKKCLYGGQSDLWHFLLEHLSPEDIMVHQYEWIMLLQNHSEDFVNSFITHAPQQLLATIEVQEEMAHIFPTLDYFTQLLFLKKLGSNVQSAELMKVLIVNLTSRTTKLNELIIKALTNNTSSFTPESLKHFISILSQKQYPLHTAQIKALSLELKSTNDLDKKTKQAIKSLNRK